MARRPSSLRPADPRAARARRGHDARRARPRPLAGAAPEDESRPLDLSLRGSGGGDRCRRGRPLRAARGEALARIEERNPELNAVIETFPERSREMLDSAPDGALRGVPVVIKDEWPLPWRAQRFGSAEHAEADGTGRVRPLPRPARRRRGDRRGRKHGRARRRQHRQRSPSTARPTTPGTPSAARAGPRAGPPPRSPARLVAGAVGADGLGSVRYPAAYCGLTGLKPTFGRSAMDGHHAAPTTTTIVSGPLCVDAADCRLLASALFGEDLAQGDASGLRIGVIRDVASEDVDPEVRRGLRDGDRGAPRGDRGQRSRRSPCRTWRRRRSRRS